MSMLSFFFFLPQIQVLFSYKGKEYFNRVSTVAKNLKQWQDTSNHRVPVVGVGGCSPTWHPLDNPLTERVR